MKIIIGELRRRNVFKVASVYLITAWIIMQIVSVVSPYLHLPTVFGTAITFVLILAFPVVCIFAWAFELTPEGLKPTKLVDKQESISHHTGKKLSATLGTLLFIAVGFIIYDKTASTPSLELTSTLATKPITDSNKDNTTAKTNSPLSIAVLPFVNMSSEKENEFFSDGLTEEILNKLARVPKLQVTARTSAFKYKNTNEDLRDIGEALGVAYILEGSVRKSQDIARITAQLIRVKDGFHLWSDTYDKSLKNAFIVQDEIANSVTSALDIILDHKARNAMKNAGIGDVEAFVAYQKGIQKYDEAHNLEDISIELLAEANHYLDIAIENAPKFNNAYVYKTDYYSHIFLGEDTSYSKEEREKAKQTTIDILKQVIDNENNLSIKATYQINYALFSDDWSHLPSYKSQIKSVDFCPSIQWIDMLQNLGFRDLSIKLNEKGQQCDPINRSYAMSLAFYYFASQDDEKTLTHMKKSEEQYGFIETFKIITMFIHARKGEYAKADELLKTFKSDERRLGLSYFLNAVKGNKQEMKQNLAELVNYAKPNENYNIKILINAAIIGDREAANKIAAVIDQDPSGTLTLLNVLNQCLCGAPFDLEHTPTFKNRIAEAHFNWPPKPILNFPLKDW